MCANAVVSRASIPVWWETVQFVVSHVRCFTFAPEVSLAYIFEAWVAVFPGQIPEVRWVVPSAAPAEHLFIAVFYALEM